MNNYEVVDLFEVGSAATTILDKIGPELDEFNDPVGVPAEAAEE
ncbi:MAG TPA: hypothetical protein VFT44_04720 [Pyrinomonadaceae bacterium]|nr:hypothetical protein [Pyrinomonadaceae bacterium]